MLAILHKRLYNQLHNKTTRKMKMTIAKYLKENERWFDVLDFLTMAHELKKFHNVDTDTKEIGEVFDSLYS